ncbi:MAG: hypothetical protein JO249_00035 [Acidobacteria bacterium]|nr:hypothetical protein [Acidobacteriota bacterium]
MGSDMGFLTTPPGEAARTHRRLLRFSRLLFAAYLAIAFLGASAVAEQSPSSSGALTSAPAILPPLSPPGFGQDASAVHPSAEAIPPSPPEVQYADGQLTIDAANSTLGDILKAVRDALGAEIDIPAKASRERMAARLGPGPAREVLSSLLGWTEYNYVIQASDDDPTSIQSILLTPRPKSSVPASSGAAISQTPSPWARRLTPAEARQPQEPGSDSSSEEAADGPEGQSPPNGSANSQSAGSQAATSAAGSDSASAPGAQSEEPSPKAEVAAAGGSDTTSDQAGKNSERMMQLQSLYEQRRQMIEEARKPSSQN